MSILERTMRMAKKRSGLAGNGPFVAGFIIGILMGGFAAGKWAPVSGSQLRNQIFDQTLLLKDQAENIALQVTTTAREVVTHA